MAPKKNMSACSVAGCESRATGRGLCNIHYQVWYRCGDPLGLSEREIIRKRLERRTDRRHGGGCWLWTGLKAHWGHGIIAINRKKRHAHRVSWWVHRGEIPPGAMICHNCRNPNCINPDHLYVGNAQTNGADMIRDGSSLAGMRNRNAKLSEQEVLKILTDKRCKAEIAREYGVSKPLISYIKMGKAWRHLSATRYYRPFPKLELGDIEKIRSASGSHRSIAAQFGISQQRVSQIRLGISPVGITL